MSGPRSVLSSAKLLALCTLVSRVTGMLRDMLLAHTLGQTWAHDAFQYAFQIPNLFRRLFGEGALSAAFVPAFTRVLDADGRAAAWRLLARTLALLTTLLAAITLLIELILVLIWLGQPDDDPQRLADRRLLLSLTIITTPFMVSICVLALLSSVLNCLGSFAAPALASVVLNVVMIGGILWLGPWMGGEDARARTTGIALSVLIAGVLQLLFLWPALRARGVTLGWRFEPRDPQVREILTRIGPVLLGQGVLLISIWLDTQLCVLLTRVSGPEHFQLAGWTIAYPLREGALSALTVAQRLYQFPLGVLVISLATVALPALSRLAVRSDWPGWGRELRGLLRMAIFEGLLAGVAMIVLAVPIVRLLFEYGRFTPADTERTARVLMCYGFALWAYCAHHIVLRGFYSIGDVRTPLRISLAILPLNLILTLVLLATTSAAESAFALSSALTSAGAVVAGVILLQRRSGERLADAATLSVLVRMVLAAGAACALAGMSLPWLQKWCEGIMPGGIAGRALETFGGLVWCSGLFLLAAAVLRLPEPGRLLRRSRGGSSADPTT